MPRGEGRAYLRGDMWWIVYFHRGKRYRESTGLRGKRNEAAARRILRAKTGEVAQGTFQPEAKITVNQIIEEFEKDYRLRGGRQFVQLHSHLKPVVASLGHLKAQDLTERRIDTYIEKRLQHVSAATINREMQPLGQALRLAHSRQLIKRVPNIPGRSHYNASYSGPLLTLWYAPQKRMFTRGAEP